MCVVCGVRVCVCTVSGLRRPRTQKKCFLRILSCQVIPCFLGLAQVSRHRYPSFFLGQVGIVEHSIKFLIERLFLFRHFRSPPPSSSSSYDNAKRERALTSYMISFSAVHSSKRLFTTSHERLEFWSSVLVFSRVSEV